MLEELVTVGQSILKELERRGLDLMEKYKSRAKELTTQGITSIDVIEARGNNVAEEIIRITDKQKVDTIVLGSRGIKSSKDFLIGSVWYKVTHYAKCTVVVVR